MKKSRRGDDPTGCIISAVLDGSGQINPCGYGDGEEMGYYITENSSVYDLYDFKYSNNSKSYMTSGQLHEYKY